MKHVIFKSATSVAVCAALSGCFDGDNKPNTNAPPVAVGTNLATQADTPIMDKLSATDADNDRILYKLVSDVDNGTLEIMSDGSFTYTPNYTFTGTDSFTFSASDGISGRSNATVEISVEALQVNFSDYSRQAFTQSATDSPLPLNGRAFTQDVSDPEAYDDLLNN